MIKAVIFDWVGTVFDWEKEQLYPGVREMLESLRGRYDLGLVTYASGGVEARRGQIRKAGVESYFKSLVIEEVKGREQYRKCLLDLRVRGEEAVVVDDQATRLMEAKKEGCQTVWVSEGRYPERRPAKGEEVDWVVRRVTELEDILG